MSVKVTIPFQDNVKVEIDGSLEEVKKTLTNMDSLFDTLKEAVGELKPAVSVTSFQEPVVVKKPITVSSEIPVISTGAKKNLRASLIELVNSDWGKQPRSLKELIEALKTNSIYRPKGSIASALFELSKANKINRYRDSPKEEWKYVSI